MFTRKIIRLDLQMSSRPTLSTHCFLQPVRPAKGFAIISSINSLQLWRAELVTPPPTWTYMLWALEDCFHMSSTSNGLHKKSYSALRQTRGQRKISDATQKSILRLDLWIGSYHRLFKTDKPVNTRIVVCADDAAALIDQYKSRWRTQVKHRHQKSRRVYD